MAGVAIIRALLAGDPAMRELVPGARIAAGVLPHGTALPAIAITRVSGTDRNIPAPGARRHVRERVQVTMLAASYPQLQAMGAAVRAACADRMPAHPGVGAVTVHTDAAGPDMVDEEASIHMTTQDYLVTYSETR